MLMTSHFLEGAGNKKKCGKGTFRGQKCSLLRQSSVVSPVKGPLMFERL